MIRVDVQEYCNCCCDFEPEATHPKKYFKDNEEIAIGDTIIRCTNAKRCEAIRRYLMRQDATYNVKE